MAPQAVPWCPRVVELVSSLAHDSLHLSHTGSLKSSPEAYLELVPSTGICITHSLGWVCPACLAAGHPFQAQGCATKAVAGEGVEDRWCLVPLWREKTHCSSWCSAWLFGCSFFFSLSRSRGGNGLPYRRNTFQKRQHHRAVQFRSASASALLWGLRYQTPQGV